MKLSIIIPLYNSGHFLGTCIKSLLDQQLDLKDYEILIVNDGSTDSSLEVAQDLAAHQTNIHVYTKPNGGVGSARNFGLAKAKGEYVYFIDPDDFLVVDTLHIILKTARKNSLDVLTFLSFQTKDTKPVANLSQESEPELSQIYSGIDYIANFRFQNEVWWYIIKKSFLEENNIRFIEDRWMEDAIITAQIFVTAKTMAKLSLDGHRHLIVEGSAMTSKEPSHYLRVIDDNRNAAIVYESLIINLINKGANPNSITRLRTRQQSFVFFMMVRILKSTIKLNRVKGTMNELSNTGAYPLNDFIGSDYNGFLYRILVVLFNRKPLYYFLFKIFNPFLK